MVQLIITSDHKALGFVTEETGKEIFPVLHVPKVKSHPWLQACNKPVSPSGN